MAVYNPYDQMIFEDPAYLTDPEKVKEQLQEETRGIANIIARTAGPVAGLITDPEAYRQTQDQKQRNQEILQQLGITNRQLNRDEMERAKAAGYAPLTTGQVLGEIPGFLYSDLVAGSEKIRAGVDYYDLDDNERMGVAMGIIDMADIAAIPAVFKKLATLGVKKFGKSNLKKMAQDPELQKQFPAETQEILAITGGGFTPAGVVREAEKGLGLTSSTPSRINPKTVFYSNPKNYQEFKNKKDLDTILRLAEIIDNTPIDQLDGSFKKIIEDNNLKNLIINDGMKKGIKNNLKKYGLISDEKLAKIEENAKSNLYKLKIQAGEESKKKILDGVENAIQNDVFYNTRKDFAEAIGISSQNLNHIRDRNPEIKEIVDNIIIRNASSQGETKRVKYIFKNETANIFSNKADLTEYFKKINPELFKKINNLRAEAKYKNKFMSPFELFQNYMYDKFRSIKQTKGNEKLTTRQFVDKYMNDQDLNNFMQYADLELQRMNANVASREIINELAKNKKYRPYLLNKDNEIDYNLLKFDKAHDIPLFVTRTEGSGRLQNVGRFKGAGVETELIQPNLQPYNFLQKNLDPYANILGDIINQEGLKKEFLKNTNLKINEETLSRENPINQKLLNLLEDYGYKPNLKKFNNQYELIEEIAEVIDGLYKDRLVRTVVPVTKKSGKKDTVIFGIEDPKAVSLNQKVELGATRLQEILDYAIENNLKPSDIKTKGGYLKSFNKGGEVKPVRMAMGGDPLTNMNQQQFMPDPAFEGEDYFNQAVESGNLYAFNPGKIFKLFSKTDAVYTPKKLPDPVAEQQAAPPGTTLPTTQVVQPEDFAFQSFTLNKILDPQAPKAGTPDAWRQFLYGGGQGGKVPEAEMFDTGIEQFLDDYAKYYPDRKIDRQTLVDYYEMSPIGNIEIKVKDARGTQPSVHSPSDDPAYKGYVGGSRHQNTGSQPLDEVGTDYREVVVKAGGLPGDKKPFVSSGHFEEENVLGFTRVADYMQPDGRKVSVIQEMQTDMLTKVRKEQERLQALLKRIENIKARAARDLQSGDPYREASATNALEQLNQAVPPTVEETLKKHQDLIKPFPNEAAKSTIPDYQKQLSDLQLQIEDVLQKDIQQSRPETGFEIQAIAKEQQKILDSLLDLNRSGQLDDMLKSVKVPSTRDTEELMRYGEDTNVRGIGDGTAYYSTKELELFPPIPFNKQADYVDLLIKSTIKDAQGRGVNKVAIYPPELVNQRWGKRPDSDAGKKFRDLYGKVAIQQMKNIAKKYGGTAQVEVVLNPNNSDRGLTYFKRNLEGEMDYLKQDQLAQGLDPDEAQMFIDEQLNRQAHTLGDKQVIYSKEVAPGQTMDYYVDPYVITEGEETIKKFNLVPLGPGDNRNAAQIIVEEYNPQEIPMFTITLDSEKAQAPMFMFKKKSGGSIDKDSLVSITDIYGEYGR